MLVTAILADRFTRFELSKELVPELGKVLGVFVAVHIVYLVGAERLPHAWAANFDFWAITSGFLVGNTVSFWLWTVVGGVIPLALLVVPALRTRTWTVFTASVFAIFGILFEGVNLIFTGYNELNIGAAPGVTTGTEYSGIGSSVWATVGAYTPTVIELLVSLELVALGALILTLGLRYFPVFPGSAVESRPRRESTGDAAAADGGTVRADGANHE